MFDLNKIMRPNVAAMTAYSSARDEFSGSASVFLDANESPFGNWNRYPDPMQKMLKNRLSEVKNVAAENIFLGNGSDEIIDLLFRSFCRPGIDKALVFCPTYGMYEVSAALNDIELAEISLTADFQIPDVPDEILKNENLKLIFICSPNNPTGNTLHNIPEILRKFNGIVVVDEAYIDFADAPSLSERLSEFPNLVVLQTLSKAWGLAGIRIGIGMASEEILSVLNKVKPPYNISSVAQKKALKALADLGTHNTRLNLIKLQRNWLVAELKKLPFLSKIHPTQSNFILIESENYLAIYEYLIRNEIVVRNRNSVVKNSLRISIGKPEENARLIELLKQFQ